MQDLISRQDAIDAMSRISDSICEAEAVDALCELPTVDAVPVKRGKWIKADSQQYFRKHYPCFACSECGYRKDSQKKWNYCPNCGAYMKGTEDD